MHTFEEKRLTKDFLKKLLKSDFKFYYSTPYLNDFLYLHYKGFPKIENLEEFTGLKVLYFEGNGCTEISGLQNCTNLRSLYLQENLIKKIENLENCTLIANLNLNENDIQKIENLSCLTNLGTLQIKRNRIGVNGNNFECLKGLLEVPSISVLDISDNYITDESVIDEVLAKMPNLAVLYLQGNEVCKKIRNYRKTMIMKLPKLKYLDDHPVFDEERRFAEAFHKGGLELEREERKKYKKEQEDEHLRNHYAFKEMIERYKREAEEEKRQQQDQQQDQTGEQQLDQEQSQPQEAVPDLEEPSNEERRSSFLNSSSSEQNDKTLQTYNTAQINQSDQSCSSKRKNSESSISSIHQQEDSNVEQPNEVQAAEGNNNSNYLDELE